VDATAERWLPPSAGDRGPDRCPLHGDDTRSHRGPDGRRMVETAATRRVRVGHAGPGVDLARAYITDPPVLWTGAGHDGVAIWLIRHMPGRERHGVPDTAVVIPPQGPLGSRGRGAPSGARTRGGPTFGALNAWAIRAGHAGPRRPAVVRMPVLTGWACGPCVAPQGWQTGQRAGGQAWLHRVRRHRDRRTPWRYGRGHWRQRRLGVPPPPEGDEGQNAGAHHVRRARDNARWTGSGFDGFRGHACGEPSQRAGRLGQPGKSPCPRGRTSTPCPPNTAGRRLWCSSLQRVLLFASCVCRARGPRGWTS
jgi:hypothetical protein